MLSFLCLYFDSLTSLTVISLLISCRAGCFNKTLSQLVTVMIINRLVITYLKDNSLIRRHSSLSCVCGRRNISYLSLLVTLQLNCISVLLIESRVISPSLGDDEEPLQQHKALLRCFEQRRHCHCWVQPFPHHGSQRKLQSGASKQV